MPYLGKGETASSEPLPVANMVVDPAKILQLKKRFEDRRDVLREYLLLKGESAFVARPPGADPCSEGNAQGITRNGGTAATATVGFVQALEGTIASLHDTAVAYRSVEEDNTGRLGREPE